jgi:hypothetical protein
MNEILKWMRNNIKHGIYMFPKELTIFENLDDEMEFTIEIMNSL